MTEEPAHRAGSSAWRTVGDQPPVVVVRRPPRADRKRGWLVNLESDPHLTFHLKRGSAQADLPATARVITDPTERRSIADWVVTNAWNGMDVDAMAAYSPMIEVTIEDLAA